MNMFPLALEGVAYATNGHSILGDVNLAIAPATRTLILGANGAGKSVLLRLMHGLLRPSAGRITWGGLPRCPGVQAMVFQRPVMLRASALANVAYGMKLAGIGHAERIARAKDALDQVGLAAIAERPARVLSGGEQQRLALARAWALRPHILFLDEPTANLDPGAARDIEQLLGRFTGQGCKIVMTTHNLGQARRLADDIVFLASGRAIEHSAADDFFREPGSPEARAFIAQELPTNCVLPV